MSTDTTPANRLDDSTILFLWRERVKDGRIRVWIDKLGVLHFAAQVEEAGDRGRTTQAQEGTQMTRNAEGRRFLTGWLVAIIVLSIAAWMSDIIWGKR